MGTMTNRAARGIWITENLISGTGAGRRTIRNARSTADRLTNRYDLQARRCIRDATGQGDDAGGSFALFARTPLYPLSAAQARRDSSFPDRERLAVQHRDDRSLAIAAGNETLRFRFTDGVTALSDHNEERA
jgi:hypothetical protein